jgi:hypothetical protein
MITSNLKQGRLRARFRPVQWQSRAGLGRLGGPKDTPATDGATKSHSTSPLHQKYIKARIKVRDPLSLSS